MTKTEYEAKIAELEKQLNALKNTDIEEELIPPHPMWMPKRNEFYYYLNTGIVSSTSWDGDESDRMSLNAGFVYISRTAAEFALERMKVLTEMREWAGKWDDAYILRYDEIRKIETYSQISPHKSYGEMRFATKEDAENCIKAVGEDRIKKYYFMIPE